MTTPDEISLPAHYRHPALLDLLADAAHGYRRAKDLTDPYAASRAARASIIAACLSIECLANCLLDDLDVQRALLKEIDKLPALAKIDLYLSLKGAEPLNRGDAAVQAATELVALRNAYVHPKTLKAAAHMKSFEEDESQVVLPFTFDAAMWPVLNIPKHSMVWDGPIALRVLGAVATFLNYVLIEKGKATEQDLTLLLIPRFEISHIAVPAVYGDFADDIHALAADGVDFDFLKI